MNKASGGDGIPAELFQILNDDAVKCYTQYASKSGKCNSGHGTGKGLFFFFFFPSPKKGHAKECSNYCTVVLSHTLAKEYLKFSKPGFNST